MSLPPRPKLIDIVRVYDNNYKTLKKLVGEDVIRGKKKNHWIWYVFPQQQVEGHPEAHFELDPGQNANMLLALFPEKYGDLLDMLYDKDLYWYMPADRARVENFWKANPGLRQRHGSATTTETSDTAGL